jgi:hypothetical protein
VLMRDDIVEPADSLLWQLRRDQERHFARVS